MDNQVVVLQKNHQNSEVILFDDAVKKGFAFKKK